MATSNLHEISSVYVTESIPVSINSIPEQKKVLKCWSVWKTESTESGSRQKVAYYTHEKHVNVSKPETWLSFSEALVLLHRYPVFEGLSFIKPINLLRFDSLGLQLQSKGMHITYYKISTLRIFIRYKCPFRRVASNGNLVKGLGEKRTEKSPQDTDSLGAGQKSPSVTIEQVSKISKDTHFNIKLTQPPKVLPQYSRFPPTTIYLKNSI